MFPPNREVRWQWASQAIAQGTQGHMGHCKLKQQGRLLITDQALEVAHGGTGRLRQVGAKLEADDDGHYLSPRGNVSQGLTATPAARDQRGGLVPWSFSVGGDPGPMEAEALPALQMTSAPLQPELLLAPLQAIISPPPPCTGAGREAAGPGEGAGRSQSPHCHGHSSLFAFSFVSHPTAPPKGRGHTCVVPVCSEDFHKCSE